jgi:gas vesicle protein GvpL/GvpF
MPALYVYAVAEGEHPDPVGLTGVADEPVRLYRHGDLAVAVSAAPDPLVGRRRDLLAHSATVEALWADGSVLPMRFGMVAPDEDGLRRDVLADPDGRLHRRLDALRNQAEITVKVWHQEDAVLREVVAEDRAIADLQARARRSGAYADQIRLGERVAAAVEAKAAADADRLLRDLTPLATDSVPGPPVDGALLNVAFLVESGQADAFLSAVDRRLGTERDRLSVRVAGPLPPYSFVEPQVQTESSADSGRRRSARPRASRSGAADGVPAGAGPSRRTRS